MVTEEKNEEECDDFDEDENAAECTKKNGRGSIQSETAWVVEDLCWCCSAKVVA